MIAELDLVKIKPLVEAALDEDIGSGDITTERVVPFDLDCDGVIIAKESGVIAGMPVTEMVFHSVDKRISLKRKIKEGDWVDKGTEIMVVSGWARAVLCAERVALNFMSHLSGIATLTKKFADKVKRYDVSIMDTRKTVPGLRILEKYAVTVGGGENHRIGLFDRILIKDNHLKIQKELGSGYIERAIGLARRRADENIEVEVENIQEAEEAVKSGADIVLLDNMSVLDIEETVKAFNGKALFEVSGGVTLENVEDIARTGVDFISIGALTHSVKALDLSLELV